MKYVYMIFEEHSGTQIGVCTSMEDAIRYTEKLQKQSEKRKDKTIDEHFVWSQLVIIPEKEIPVKAVVLGYKRKGTYTIWNGWSLEPLDLIQDDSPELVTDYTNQMPDVQFEFGNCGMVNFTVTSSMALSDEEILNFVIKTYEERIK